MFRNKSNIHAIGDSLVGQVKLASWSEEVAFRAPACLATTLLIAYCVDKCRPDRKLQIDSRGSFHLLRGGKSNASRRVGNWERGSGIELGLS